MLRLGIDTHVITSHYALPLLIRRPGGLVVEVTDGTADYNRATATTSASTSPRTRRTASPSASPTSWRNTAARRSP